MRQVSIAQGQNGFLLSADERMIIANGVVKLQNLIITQCSW